MSEIIVPWISSPTRYLTKTEMEHNAEIFARYFIGQGWTIECIAAMLGNIQTESYINPGLWQGRTIPADPLETERGFGLTQWTPARKLINWATENQLEYTDGYTQLQRILYEQQNNLQWSTDNILKYTWNDFIVSTESPEILARVFVWAYERPSDPDIPLRQQQARQWYAFIKRMGKIPVWLLFKIRGNWRRF